MQKEILQKKIQNLHNTLDIWSPRNLTIFGRCLIFKCSGISHLTYSTSMLVVPSEIITSRTVSLFNFIWCKNPDKVKRQVLYQDYQDGLL